MCNGQGNVYNKIVRLEVRLCYQTNLGGKLLTGLMVADQAETKEFAVKSWVAETVENKC